MESDDLENLLNTFFHKLEGIDSKLSGLKPAKVRKNRWIYGAEVMKILKISASTLRRRRLNNEIPFKKIGGSYYYPSIFFEQVLLDMSKRDFGDKWKD